MSSYFVLVFVCPVFCADDQMTMVHNAIHATLANLLRLVPSARLALAAQLKEFFPHESLPAADQQVDFEAASQPGLDG